MSFRIVGGQYKGRTLKTPKGSSTRPTQGMLREAVFNICQNEIEQASFLDLFAGSGAMGLEALSRGASHATFVEKHPEAIRCIKENIEALSAAAQTTLLPCPLTRALKHLSKTPFNILYLDPPYDLPLAPILKELLSYHLLAPNALLFAEEFYRPKAIPFASPELHHEISRRFGTALLHQYRFLSTKGK